MGRYLRSYPAVIVGLVVLLSGVAAAGIALTLAGRHAPVWATAFGSGAAFGVVGGLSALVVVFHRRGGLLRSRVSTRERRVYRTVHRDGEREANSDSSRTRRV